MLLLAISTRCELLAICVSLIISSWVSILIRCGCKVQPRKLVNYSINLLTAILLSAYLIIDTKTIVSSCHLSYVNGLLDGCGSCLACLMLLGWSCRLTCIHVESSRRKLTVTVFSLLLMLE